MTPLYGDFMDYHYLPANFHIDPTPKKDNEFWWCDSTAKVEPTLYDEMG